MKHTKGEWKFKKNKSFLEVTSSYEGETLMQVNVFLFKEHNTDKEITDYNFCDENIANAKLIAAAPELLEVCKEVLKSDIDGSFVSASKWWKKMEQAIKKATE